MKIIIKNIKAGIGKAIGFALVYVTIAIILAVLGVEIDLSNFPPSLEGEIVQTIIE